MLRLLIVVLFGVVFQVSGEGLKPIKLKSTIEGKGLELTGFHNFHVSEFVNADGFGQKRVFIMPKKVELIVDENKYRLIDMKLLSVTDRKKAVVWEFPGEKNRHFSIWSTFSRKEIENGRMKKRPIDTDELEDLNKLKEGGKWVLHKSQKDLRVIAPLHGGQTCIRCHEDYKEGEFMGAFMYDLTVIEKQPSENKEDDFKKKEISKLLQDK